MIDQVQVDRFRLNLRSTKYNELKELIAHYSHAASESVKPSLWQKITHKSDQEVRLERLGKTLAVLKQGMPESWRVSEGEVAEYWQVFRDECQNRYPKMVVSQPIVRQILGCITEVYPTERETVNDRQGSQLAA